MSIQPEISYKSFGKVEIKDFDQDSLFRQSAPKPDILSAQQGSRQLSWNKADFVFKRFFFQQFLAAGNRRFVLIKRNLQKGNQFFFELFLLSPVVHVINSEYPINLRIIKAQIFHIKCPVRPKTFHLRLKYFVFPFWFLF